jgi:hypothetical protein
MPFSTIKVDMPLRPCSGSVIAMITWISARDPLVMNILLPFITQPSPFFTARVFMAAASEPAAASVSAQAPSVSPVANRGRYFFFCSSEPKRLMWLEQREL